MGNKDLEELVAGPNCVDQTTISTKIDHDRMKVLRDFLEDYEILKTYTAGIKPENAKWRAKCKRAIYGNLPLAKLNLPKREVLRKNSSEMERWIHVLEESLANVNLLKHPAPQSIQQKADTFRKRIKCVKAEQKRSLDLQRKIENRTSRKDIF